MRAEKQEKWDKLWLFIVESLESKGLIVTEGNFSGKGSTIIIDFYCKKGFNQYPLPVKETVAKRLRPENTNQNREKVLDILKELGLKAKEFKLTYYPHDNTLCNIEYYIECL